MRCFECEGRNVQRLHCFTTLSYCLISPTQEEELVTSEFMLNFTKIVNQSWHVRTKRLFVVLCFLFSFLLPYVRHKIPSLFALNSTNFRTFLRIIQTVVHFW